MTLGGTGLTGGGGVANQYAKVLIEEQILTGSQASITFSNIDQTYKNLYLEMSTRVDRAGLDIDSLYVEFNGDTTAANYYRQADYSNNGTQSSQEAADKMFAISCATTAPSDCFSSINSTILDYTGTKLKNISSVFNGNINSSNSMAGMIGNTWLNTSVITSIKIQATGGVGFLTGSTFKLIGEKLI